MGWMIVARGAALSPPSSSPSAPLLLSSVVVPTSSTFLEFLPRDHAFLFRRTLTDAVVSDVNIGAGVGDGRGVRFSIDLRALAGDASGTLGSEGLLFLYSAAILLLES